MRNLKDRAPTSRVESLEQLLDNARRVVAEAAADKQGGFVVICDPQEISRLVDAVDGYRAAAEAAGGRRTMIAVPVLDREAVIEALMKSNDLRDLFGPDLRQQVAETVASSLAYHLPEVGSGWQVILRAIEARRLAAESQGDAPGVEQMVDCDRFVRERVGLTVPPPVVLNLEKMREVRAAAAIKAGEAVTLDDAGDARPASDYEAAYKGRGFDVGPDPSIPDDLRAAGYWIVRLLSTRPQVPAFAWLRSADLGGTADSFDTAVRAAQFDLGGRKAAEAGGGAVLHLTADILSVIRDAVRVAYADDDHPINDRPGGANLVWRTCLALDVPPPAWTLRKSEPEEAPAADPVTTAAVGRLLDTAAEADAKRAAAEPEQAVSVFGPENPEWTEGDFARAHRVDLPAGTKLRDMTAQQMAEALGSAPPISAADPRFVDVDVSQPDWSTFPRVTCWSWSRDQWRKFFEVFDALPLNGRLTVRNRTEAFAEAWGVAVRARHVMGEAEYSAWRTGIIERRPTRLPDPVATPEQIAALEPSTAEEIAEAHRQFEADDAARVAAGFVPGALVEAKGDNPEGAVDDPGMTQHWREGDRFYIGRGSDHDRAFITCAHGQHFVDPDDWAPDFKVVRAAPAPIVDQSDLDLGDLVRETQAAAAEPDTALTDMIKLRGVLPEIEDAGVHITYANGRWGFEDGDGGATAGGYGEFGCDSLGEALNAASAFVRDAKSAETGEAGDDAERSCRICGCTERRACVTAGVHCSWSAADPEICTACEPLARALDDVGALQQIIDQQEVRLDVQSETIRRIRTERDLSRGERDTYWQTFKGFTDRVYALERTIAGLEEAAGRAPIGEPKGETEVHIHVDGPPASMADALRRKAAADVIPIRAGEAAPGVTGSTE